MYFVDLAANDAIDLFPTRSNLNKWDGTGCALNPTQCTGTGFPIVNVLSGAFVQHRSAAGECITVSNKWRYRQVLPENREERLCPERAGPTFWKEMRSASGFGVAQCFARPLRGNFLESSGFAGK